MSFPVFEWSFCKYGEDSPGPPAVPGYPEMLAEYMNRRLGLIQSYLLKDHSDIELVEAVHKKP